MTVPQRTSTLASLGRQSWAQRRARWIATLLLAAIVALSACTEEGQAELGEALENVDTSQLADAAEDVATSLQEEAPAETAQPEPEETPAPTEPPVEATEEAAPAPAEDGADDEGLSSEDWILILALGIAALAIFIGATSAASRRSDAKAAARAELQGRLSEIVGGSRWVHDSGSTEVLLATDPDQMQMAWNEVRGRMINLESQIATLAAGSDDQHLDNDLRYLGQCIADLRSAEEAYVSTRLRAPAGHTELTRTSDQTVSARRQQLQAAIDPVAAAMRR